MRIATLLAAALALDGGCAHAGPDRVRTLDVGGGRVEVTLRAGRLDLSDEQVLAWIAASARAVTAYLGRFPVPTAHVYVHPDGGRGPSGGRTNEDDGGEIHVRLGRRTRAADLADDWVMTHEMVHLAFPTVEGERRWLEEGVATYVEPLGRVRAGGLDAARMWADVVRDLPQGLPRAGDRGLDFTPTWARTYWGGALFYLLADVEIRARTGCEKGLEHALRGILDAGGSVVATWDVERLVAAGDAATGVPVLRELYAKMRDRPYPVDLPSLWRRLGIVPDGRGGVRFDDGAPDAAIRRGITTGRCRAD